jgi:hypothetical protein
MPRNDRECSIHLVIPQIPTLIHCTLLVAIQQGDTGNRDARQYPILGPSNAYYILGNCLGLSATRKSPSFDTQVLGAIVFVQPSLELRYLGFSSRQFRQHTPREQTRMFGLWVATKLLTRSHTWPRSAELASTRRAQIKPVSLGSSLLARASTFLA